jgi:predicted nucleic acid-binding protein
MQINYAWDTTVLIAWLSEEPTAPLDDIGLVADRIDAKNPEDRDNLIISVTTFSEILECKYTEEQLEKLNQFLKRSNVLKVETTFKIAKKASEIRAAGEKEGRKIKTPDAQIVAAAITYRAHVLHTLDDKLLKLHGSTIVDGLPITLPKLFGGGKALPFFQQGGS